MTLFHRASYSNCLTTTIVTTETENNYIGLNRRVALDVELSIVFNAYGINLTYNK